jgi:protein TonB
LHRESLAIHPADPDLAQAPWWRGLKLVLPTDVSRRSAGLALAIAIELLIVLLLLSLGFTRSEPDEETVAITSFDVSEPPAEPAEEQAASEPAAASAQETAEPQIEESVPATPAVVPLPSALPLPSVRPTPQPTPTPVPAPSPTPSSRIGAVVRSDRSYGPADTGSSRGEDSPIVGTAPDGSPLYAARWYREPGPEELSGYLSTASSTGWGLIACRTAPNWRVEDCAVVSEYPANSGIARAVQAAAWQFRVRPPRIGGQYQVGSWVRIRIDYTRSQRPQNY